MAKSMPLPQSAAEADFQLKKVSKELKRRWLQESNPHSLTWVDEKWRYLRSAVTTSSL
jgi:hypothetical protein